MKEHDFELNTLMGGWYISEKICDNLVLYFNENKNEHFPGMSGNKVNKDIKDSVDIQIKKNHKNSILSDYENALDEVMKNYRDKYSELKKQQSYSINEDWNIQYYKPNGGFKKWHCENSYYDNVSSRVLVFQTFLNDVDGGGTEFLYQNKLINAKKGLTLIWPAYWTHTHKGQISNKNEKYIATGWYSDDKIYSSKAQNFFDSLAKNNPNVKVQIFNE